MKIKLRSIYSFYNIVKYIYTVNWVDKNKRIKCLSLRLKRRWSVQWIFIINKEARKKVLSDIFIWFFCVFYSSFIVHMFYLDLNINIIIIIIWIKEFRFVIWKRIDDNYLCLVHFTAFILDNVRALYCLPQLLYLTFKTATKCNIHNKYLHKNNKIRNKKQIKFK